MRRFVFPVVVPALLLAAACGGPVSASSPKASPSPGRGFRNGASGQLVKITGSTLILSGVNGDTTVTFDSTTRIQRTSTASVGDIVPGVCFNATGQKDATGAITAAVVRLTTSSNTPCSAPIAGNRPSPGTEFGPIAGNRPSPPANVGFVTGVVSAVSGIQVTVKETNGTVATVTVPTTVRVSRTAAATSADLQIGECVTAAGQRDSSGTVAARALIISPPSASGTCGGFGRGGFGGGGFFGGGAVPQG